VAKRSRSAPDAAPAPAAPAAPTAPGPGADSAASIPGGGVNRPALPGERGREGPLSIDPLIRRHLAFGWWSLAVFTALGLVLEAAHGLKLGWYLDAGAATRRLSFTLAHAHGTLLGVIHIAFALSLGRIRMSDVAVARASFALRAATVLLPLGFLLGGLAFYAGDPGFAIALVPPSGALLLVALVVIARAVSSRPRG
jgi:hypothetical protein